MTHYPKAYTGEEPYIFISYAHKDSDRVLSLIQGLMDRGFRVWYDAGIEVATEWPEYIAQRLVGSGCVLAFISKAALDSHNCRREINFAIEMKKDPLVVYLEDAELSYGMRMQLGSLQAIYYTRHDTETAFLEKLAEAAVLAPCRGTPPPSAEEEERKKLLQETERNVKTWAEVMQIMILAGLKPDMQADMYPTLQLVSATKRGVDQVAAVADMLYDNKYLEDALALYLFAGTMDHAEATKKAGVCYYQGLGTQRDFGKAATFFRIAAEKGEKEAQFFLAILYEQGQGVPKSLEDAIAWYEKAGKTEEANRCRKLLG